MATTTLNADPHTVHRLELYNFKSYHGKVSVGPFKDFTCIVGPNGSGKSNLMDALSFVLGSNAATLRGEKVTDLINKKAKKKECSVTLVLKNTKGEEKKLTRAVTVKGSDSTVTTTVDDINVSDKEFVATLKKFKLGQRLSTFLVFQHEVDAVAQKKAREITELIEQVSGSIDCKPEYERAKKELDAANKAMAEASYEKRGAQAELQQVRLHKQEAERYGQVLDRLHTERRDLALGELFHIEAQLTITKKQLAIHAAEVERLRGAAGSEGDQAKAKKEYAAKHQQYLEELRKARDLNSKLRENRSTLERIKASAAHFTAKLARQQQQLGSTKSSDAVRSKELARLQEQLKQQEALLQSLETKWAQEDASDERSLKKLAGKDLEEYKMLRRDADCATITTRQSVETLRRQRDAIREAARQTQNQIDRLQSTVNDDEGSIGTNEDRIKAINARVDDAKAQHRDVSAKLDDLRASTHQQSIKDKERDEELAAIDAQLRELRFVKEDNRHGQRVAEALDALKAMHPGVRGRLVDLCTVKDNKYRNAVTVAFGRNLEAIVVDSVETAMACVRYLKEQRVASLTFIPLIGAQGSAVDDSLRTMGGTCKPVIDLLKFDASIEPAVRYAMGRTLCCDTLTEARKVAYDGEERQKVVTVDGTQLLKNGSVQGGLASIQARARKWDEKGYDDLKRRREELVRDGAGSVSEAEALRSRQQAKELQARAEQLENRIARDLKEVQDLQAKNATLADGKKKLEKQIVELSKALQAAKTKTDALDKDIEKRQADIGKEEEKFFGPFQKRVGIPNVADLEHHQQQEAKVRAEKRQQLTIAIHKLKTAVDAEARRSAAEQSAADVTEAVKLTEQELASCQHDLRTCQGLVDRAGAEVHKAQDRINALKAEVDELEARIRQRSKNTEAEVRQLATERKHATMLQGACEALRQQRADLFQRCRLDEVELPTIDPAAAAKRGRDRDDSDNGSDSDDDDNPREAGAGRGETGKKQKKDKVTLLRTSEAFTSFSESGTAQGAGRTSGRKSAGGAEVSVMIDFTSLPKAVRSAARDKVSFADFKAQSENVIGQLERELETIAPNLKAASHLQTSENKLGQSANSVEQCRDRQLKALRDFNKVKEIRTARFSQTVDRLSEHVAHIYRELTLGTRARQWSWRRSRTWVARATTPHRR
jgi:structural maintenance of chromosome 1